MTELLTKCLNGCHTSAGPVYTEGRAQICGQCEKRLAKWLTDIPDNYDLLPTFIEHGTTDANPENKATKRSEAAAPMRLEVIDLLDTRLGRKWNGTAPAHDRRGVIGTLRVHVENLIEDRPLTATKISDTSVREACDLLHRHRLWLAEQDWITFLYDDVSKLHRALADAVGDYKRPAVGRCYVIPENADKECGGPLFANATGGVHCARCREEWPTEKLRRLGLALNEGAGAA